MIETKYNVYFPFCLFSGLPNPPANTYKTLQPNCHRKQALASSPTQLALTAPSSFPAGMGAIGHRIN